MMRDEEERRVTESRMRERRGWNVLYSCEGIEYFG